MPERINQSNGDQNRRECPICSLPLEYSQDSRHRVILRDPNQLREGRLCQNCWGNLYERFAER
jgi:hypothetical protein